MRLGKLGEQLVIKSKFAFSKIRFEGFEPAGKDTYYVLRKTRDDSANQSYLGILEEYYQWYSSRNYSEIFQALCFDDLRDMYDTLHEADISKFAEIADERIREHFKDTNLKRIRSVYGCTQAELAKVSGVALRSIQMYEQRRKDINKASAEALYRIAKVLGCTIEDLIEK